MSVVIRNAGVLTMDDDGTELPRADILGRGTRSPATVPGNCGARWRKPIGAGDKQPGGRAT